MNEKETYQSPFDVFCTMDQPVWRHPACGEQRERNQPNHSVDEVKNENSEIESHVVDVCNVRSVSMVFGENLTSHRSSGSVRFIEYVIEFVQSKK